MLTSSAAATSGVGRIWSAAQSDRPSRLLAPSKFRNQRICLIGAPEEQAACIPFQSCGNEVSSSNPQDLLGPRPQEGQISAQELPCGSRARISACRPDHNPHGDYWRFDYVRFADGEINGYYRPSGHGGEFSP